MILSSRIIFDYLLEMRLFFLLVFLWSGTALAQTYPDYQSTTVNDFANLLNGTDEAALSKQLDQLRRETGVEMTVLTLETQSDYAPDQSLEQFATGLFNHWGIGDARRNDGVLVMIIRNDRAMRIELGRAFARDWDRAAARVIDDHFLDAFADGDYPRGILQGSAAVKDEIILPFLANEDPPKSSDDNFPWIIGVFVALIAAMKGRHKIGDAVARFRTCPKCGKRALRQSRRILMKPSTTTSGAGLRRVHCTNCDYKEEFDYSIPRRSSKSSGRFGGGSSGGGGASGRW